MLALPDAVANKVGALYSRAYLDVDAIRQADRYTDEQLLDLTAEHDIGFERQMFASLLARGVSQLTDSDVNLEEVAEVKQRLGELVESTARR